MEEEVCFLEKRQIARRGTREVDEKQLAAGVAVALWLRQARRLATRKGGERTDA